MAQIRPIAFFPGPVLAVGEDAPTSLGQFLSNFTATPYDFQGVTYESAEGLIQGLRWPSGSPERIELASLSGIEARRLGNLAPSQASSTHIPMFEFWNHRIFNRTNDHVSIMRLAIRDKILFFPPESAELAASSGTIGVKDSEDFNHVPQFRGVIAEAIELTRQELRSGETPLEFQIAISVLAKLTSSYLRNEAGIPVFTGAGGIP